MGRWNNIIIYTKIDVKEPICGAWIHREMATETICLRSKQTLPDDVVLLVMDFG
jgi:hypothetical protein